MPKTILIFAYYSYKDPVFQSAVLPYFVGLFNKENIRFILLTFEQPRYRLTKKEILKIQNELLNHNIIWHQSHWRSGRFKPIKKVIDFIWGIIYSGFLIIKYRVAGIYSEGFPGAVIAHHLSKLFSIPHFIHTYEPHTDYMVEAGVWKKTSWEAVLLKKYEIIVAQHAEYIFTATNAMIEKLENLKIKGTVIRVPSCVDLNVFKFSSLHRTKVRNQLNIKENDCVITCLGKFGGMYMDEEIYDFFKACEENQNQNFKYFIFTPDSITNIKDNLSKNGLDESRFFIRTLERNEIYEYLSASDFGLVPVRQYPGKRFCSPIKDGEYWACGLPILIPDGISDDYQFARQNNIGIVMEDMGRKSLENTVERMIAWLNKNDKEDVVKRCRAFVQKDRSIEKYKGLYKKIFLEN